MNQILSWKRITALVTCGVFGALAFSARPVQAGLIYSNGAPNQINGNEITGWIMADDFSIGSATDLTDVRFWNFDSGNYNGSFTWQIYGANPSDSFTPGALLFSGNTADVTRTVTDTNVLGFFTEYQNDFSIGTVTLNPGTYWLGLHNGTLSEFNIESFYWSQSSPTFNGTAFANRDEYPFNDGDWIGGDTQNAFQLFGNPAVTAVATPEPGTWALMSVGLTGLAFVRRRKKLSASKSLA